MTNKATAKQGKTWWHSLCAVTLLVCVVALVVTGCKGENKPAKDGAADVPFRKLVVDWRYENMKEIEDRRAEVLKLQNYTGPGYARFDGDIEYGFIVFYPSILEKLSRPQWAALDPSQDFFSLDLMYPYALMDVEDVLVRAPRPDDLAERLIGETMARSLIMAQRLRFANTWLNGEKLGLRTLEETTDVFFVRSQGYAIEGRVLTFENWLSDTPFDTGDETPHYLRSGEFWYKKKEKFPQCKGCGDARKRLQKFMESAGDTEQNLFRHDRTGAYLAIAELWGAYLLAAEQQMALYYDPYSNVMHPVYLYGGGKHFIAPDARIAESMPLARKLLENNRIRQSYNHFLGQMVKDILDKKGLYKPLEQIASTYQPMMETRGGKLPFNNMGFMDYLQARAEFLSHNKPNRRPE